MRIEAEVRRGGFNCDFEVQLRALYPDGTQDYQSYSFCKAIEDCQPTSANLRRWVVAALRCLREDA